MISLIRNLFVSNEIDKIDEHKIKEWAQNETD